MDLRQVGLVYLVLTTAVVVAFFARTPSRPLVVAGWLYVLVDPGFLLFFNSFFADAALFVGLFGTSVWLLGESWTSRGRSHGSATPWRCRAIGLLLLVIIGGAAKMLYILLPAAVLAAVASLHVRPAPGQGTKGRRMAVILPLLLLAVSIPWFYFVGPAPRFVRVNNYHAVFAGIVPVSRHPEAVFQSLDIPADYRDLPRTDIWSGDVPLDHPVFERLSTLSRWKLLSLYLTDSAALRSTASRISRALGQLITHPQRTFSQESGRRRPAEQYAVGWQFSRLHAWVFGTSLLTAWMVIVIALAWLGVSATRGQWEGHHAAALLLVLFALNQFVVVILGDGFVALWQHLVGARLALDLLLVLLAHEALAAMRRAPLFAGRD